MKNEFSAKLLKLALDNIDIIQLPIYYWILNNGRNYYVWSNFMFYLDNLFRI